MADLSPVAQAVKRDLAQLLHDLSKITLGAPTTAAARQFLREAGFTDASGNWLPQYQPSQETE